MSRQDFATQSGLNFEEFDWLAKQDPEFDRALWPFSTCALAREAPALPHKYRALVTAAVLAFRHYHTAGNHLERALKEGATMQEVVEAMEAAAVAGGMPTLHFVLPQLARLDAEYGDGAD